MAQLPVNYQVQTWNNFFGPINSHNLNGVKNSRQLGKTIKSLQIGQYYMYCELRYCYSCGEKQRLLAKRQELKSQQEAEKARILNEKQDKAYKDILGTLQERAPKQTCLNHLKN